jgi:hypothetical protein
MNKRFLLWILYICFFLVIAFLVLFITGKTELVFVLCALELFLILLTISCYLMLQNIKDNYVAIYKVRYFFLIILDFMILLAIIGVLTK